jgi:hypothetical protein
MARTLGSAPSSPLCKSYDSTLKTSSANTLLDVLAKQAATAGDWQSARRVYLSSFKSEEKVDQELVTALSSAAPNIRAAAVAIATFEAKMPGIVRKAKNGRQFSSATGLALKNPSLRAAEYVLGNYLTGQCGSSSTAG